MNLLRTIADHKLNEVEQQKKLYPIAWLEQTALFNRTPVSLAKQLLLPDVSGIIAEFKRQSPSKGIINDSAKVEEVTAGYRRSGASALSILTDNRFFGGKNQDLTIARESNDCAILRKDFIVDPYQVIEAKSIGADAILLIAAILTPIEALNLATLAKSLGLETILEVHNIDELGHLNDQVSILGVNNRNLSDFTVSLDISFSLSKFIPKGILAISESGIHHPEDIYLLKKAGYKGFLMGEQFMSGINPVIACRDFISELRLISQ
jgi:indole-3-glycerol phosphate synthase